MSEGKTNGKAWKVLDWSECPTCGDSPEVFTSTDLDEQEAYDGDEVRCASCGHPGQTSCDEEHADIAWHDMAPGECDCEWCKKQDAKDKGFTQ